MASSSNSENVKLEYLFSLLSSNPSLEELSSALDAAGFTGYNFERSQKLAQELLNNRALYLESLQSLGTRLNKSLEEINEAIFQNFKGIESEIVNDNMTLLAKLLYSEYPEILGRLERLWRLPLTENLNSLVENYRRKHYTRQCEAYGLDKNVCLEGAARWGHLDSVEYFISKGANNFNGAMSSAARGGHRDLVEFFIKKGANDFNGAMIWTAREGHRNLVDFFIGKGANHFNAAIIMAARGGHRDLVEFFIKKGANDLNGAMTVAAIGGHRDLVELLISKGADDFNEAMLWATLGGHRDLAEYLRSRINNT